MNINFYSVLTLLIVLTAVFSYVNIRFIKLPATIGMMLLSLVCSLIIVIGGTINPEIARQPIKIIRSIDFETLLMRIMLSFLLFAGAIHIDVKRLQKEIVPIATFSTIGVLISTGIIGGLMYLLFSIFQLPVPFIYCLLFGALISPTDPIAVLGILKEAKIPPSLEIKIAGESLFNDGVGVVIFISILEIAQTGVDHLTFGRSAWTFIQEAGGGIIWGILLGNVCFYLIRSIDQYQVEVLVTLAIVMGGYLMADWLHISGPLAMVIAGIITGNKTMEIAMSDVAQDYLKKFWELIDEILNAMLFLLIGFEVLIFSFHYKIVCIGIVAIVIVLAARYMSVFLPTLMLSFRRPFERNQLRILTWGGLRGGISVALALSLPENMYKNEFVSITYIIVAFSILVQGLTIGKMAKKLHAVK